MFRLENIGSKKTWSNAFATAPGRCRQVEEKQMANSDKLPGRNSATLKYDEQTTE